MRFIQIIDYVTQRPEEIEAISEKFRAEAGSDSTTERVTVTQDRDRPGHYLVIAEFESYDSAMKNSEHPATQEFARRMSELCDGPPTFYNLDVVRENG